MKIRKSTVMLLIALVGVIFVIALGAILIHFTPLFKDGPASILETKKVEIVIERGEAFTDLDGNVYETVIIGGKTWLASNFKCRKSRNGSALIKEKDVRGGTLQPAFYVIDQNPSSERETRSVFYNWAGANAVCPKGWHIPSISEWENMLVALNLSLIDVDRKSVSNKLLGKASASGFNALFTGSWDAGKFFDYGNYAAFWSATEYPSDSRDMYLIKIDADGLYQKYFDKRCAFSLRLVKD